MTDTVKQPSLLCYHCGDLCNDSNIALDDKRFCCTGCRTVYEILQENNLCQYYTINDKPGTPLKQAGSRGRFEILDNPQINGKLIDFTDGNITSVTFFIPRMHCSSCIWLLENLFKINPSIIRSRVDFLNKQLSVNFLEKGISLRKLAELLDSIGYAPQINTGDLDKGNIKVSDKSLYYKIGIAGFCFANIMLLSFPEYLSIVNNVDPFLKKAFGLLIIILSIPVFFYCSSDYFVSAVKGIRKKIINIDLPIALGIFVLFCRSLFEIISSSGGGYMDSLAGLVFFLLLGRLFQTKSYETLNFERNYKAYFPISVTRIKNGQEEAAPASDLQPGDRIIVHNNELIPADTVLIKGKGFIDYSFITGEPDLQEKNTGDTIYAGGRQKGTALELEVINHVSRSYITRLWNNSDFTKPDESGIILITNKIGKNFTIIILFIALISAIYWLFAEPSIAWNAVTSVLIVACPCALALSVPFTFGNAMRVFGRKKFYLKNTSIIEKLSRVDTIVFDKTGTLTKSGGEEPFYCGEELSAEENVFLKSVLKNSTHPLSRRIFHSLEGEANAGVLEFTELEGKGILAEVEGQKIRVGSGIFTGAAQEQFDGEATSVYVSFNGKVKGRFTFPNYYREGIGTVISSLSGYELAVLSGDNQSEMGNLRKYFGPKPALVFNQSPEDKLYYIKQLQMQGKRVLMIGDGLNDAGALMRADAGISISEDTNSFSPACDAILDASEFPLLGKFLLFVKSSIIIIKLSFIISFLYNIIGVSFAVRGELSPLIAAILMPLSSITVVLFATLAVNMLAKKRKLN